MIGQQISSYRILERIAAGQNGTVYKAEHTTLGKTVALKFIHPARMAEPECRHRFAHEARAAARLDHVAICKVFDFEEYDRTAFIAMDFLEGETLRSRLGNGPLTIKEALLMGIQVAEGLVEAHRHGIIHRDIKPENLMVTSLGRNRFQMKILDFGVARSPDSSHITRTGSLLGTLRYMAPEQIQSRPIDARTDIWALGVVLYEMIHGEPPFRGEHIEAVQYEVLHLPPQPLRHARPEVHPRLDYIVGTAMRVRRAERYPDAEAILKDLRRHFCQVRGRRHVLSRWLKRYRPRISIGP